MTASNLDPEHLKVLRSELLGLIEAAHLPGRVDDDAIEKLAVIQANLHEEIGDLAWQLSEGVISRKGYIDGLEMLLANATEAGEIAMGREQFHAVFGYLRANSFGDANAFAET